MGTPLDLRQRDVVDREFLAQAAECLGVDVPDLRPTAHLANDLHAERIDFLDMKFRMERMLREAGISFTFAPREFGKHMRDPDIDAWEGTLPSTFGRLQTFFQKTIERLIANNS